MWFDHLWRRARIFAREMPVSGELCWCERSTIVANICSALCHVFIDLLLSPQTASVAAVSALSLISFSHRLEAEADLVSAEDERKLGRVKGEVHARRAAPAGERAERRARPVGGQGRDEVAGAEEQA